MIFKSERLIFREFTEVDFQLYYSLFSNEQVMKYAWIDRFRSEEEGLAYFKKILENNVTTENRPSYEFAVFLSTDNTNTSNLSNEVKEAKFIGFADIVIHKKNPFGGWGEIGYFLFPEFWGFGYATEIANTLIEFSFKQLKLHKVDASCNYNNYKSERIMKKVGMVKEGELRKVRFKEGRWDNELRYSILIDEWEQKNKV
jgi:ribosomal-protein-alanine N-acetyltransferase